MQTRILKLIQEEMIFVQITGGMCPLCCSVLSIKPRLLLALNAVWLISQ